MDVLDIFLRVCLWGSIVLLVILLFWALFGGWLSGSGKRSRPKPQPTRRQGFVPPPPSYARPGPEDSSSTASGEAASPQPEAPKRPGDPKPEPMRRRGLIPPPPTYGKPRREDSSSGRQWRSGPSPALRHRSAWAIQRPKWSSFPKSTSSRVPFLTGRNTRFSGFSRRSPRISPAAIASWLKTSLGEVLAPQMASGSKAARDLAFRSINSKRLDFLVIDGYGMPVLAVEYQGHGHYNDRTFHARCREAGSRQKGRHSVFGDPGRVRRQGP